MASLYKTVADKEEVLKIYQDKLDELNIDYKYQIVDTKFGATNIIVTGNPENPPLVLVHGSNGCAPIALEIYPNLTDKYQVFAVDVIAQPNRSAETRPSMKDKAYGVWMNEVIQKLGLKDVVMAGFSFGGLVILKTLLQDESNIKEVFLIAPAYIVNGNPLIAMKNMFFPMKKYMKTKDTTYIERFLGALFTERDEFAVNFLSKVFLCFEMDFSPVPTIKTGDAKSITTPITLIGAKNDLIFPGTKMIKRAKKIFPSLKKFVLLENSKHVQSAADNLKVEQMILG